MRIADQAWDYMVEVARNGNIASKSDVQVGARALEVGIWGAYQNVMINTGGIKDEKFVAEKTGEAEKLRERADKMCREVITILDNRSE
jgi:glutamate formiminotransferase/formiminotetrahydrofolate cyclodeaminase